jgi:hypothetical protein
MCEAAQWAVAAELRVFKNPDTIRALLFFTAREGGDGMSIARVTEQPAVNPLEVIENLATANNWQFERTGSDEITFVVSGKWSEYQASFNWMYELEALHFALAFEFKVPEHCRDKLHRLVTLINEQLWVGHFDLWFHDGIVMYRNALVLAGGVTASVRQCEAMLSAALNACERYYPAFQYVVWGGENAQEALQASMFETSGRA